MPSWFNNAIIYQILIDRFASDRLMKPDCGLNEFLGGNINGVRRKLDYIHSLGVTCIWLSPFCETDQYHGYHITNFDEVEPRFGSIDDLKCLVDECHTLGMQIIVDWVPNHCSIKHPFFVDAQTNPNSEYRDWFLFESWPDGYLRFLHFSELAKINLNNPNAREYMVANALRWLELGIDGFRIDHAIGPSMGFWKELRRTVKRKFPEALLIGEVWAAGIPRSDFKTLGIKGKTRRRRWGINQQELQLDYSQVFDGVLDFHFAHTVREHFRRKGLPTGQLRIDCANHFEMGYSPAYSPVLFLDNHDLDRFLFVCHGKPARLIAAIRFLFEQPFPVVIYYGTEALMSQGSTIHSNQPFADLQARQPMAWDSLNADVVGLIKRLAEEKLKGDKYRL